MVFMMGSTITHAFNVFFINTPKKHHFNPILPFLKFVMSMFLGHIEHILFL